MIRIGGASQANISASIVATWRRSPSMVADPVPGHRSDCLHAFEYAATPECKAIVKSLWDGGDVMVVSVAAN